MSRWTFDPCGADDRLRPFIGAAPRVVRPGASGQTWKGDDWALARDVSATVRGVCNAGAAAAQAQAFHRRRLSQPHESTADLLPEGFACELLVTNLGVVPPTALGTAWAVEGWSGPSVPTEFGRPAQALGVATSSGRMQLVHTSSAPPAGPPGAVVDRLRAC